MKKTKLKIDMHTHILPATMPNWTQKFGYGDFIWMKETDDPKFGDMMQGNEFFRRIEENCWNEDVRIKDYDQYETDVQIICTIPVMFSYWAKGKDGLELSQFLNDHIAEVVAKYPKKYVGLGTIPMQDPELAIQEMERCKNELGFKGIQIGSNINDKNLSEPEFFPIFEAAERLNMALMIHPWEMMGFDSMKKYWLPWLVGMPAETSRAACSLVFGGVMERLPNLRVVLSHSGGSFIPTIGRIEHGFNCRPDLVQIDNKVNPREYLKRFYFDGITHDIDFTKYIISQVGSERIAMGTDYPFPLGDLEIGKFMEESDMSQEDLDNIMYKTSLELFDLKEEDFLE